MGIEVTQLDTAAPLGGDEYLAAVQGGKAVKVPASHFKLLYEEKVFVTPGSTFTLFGDSYGAGQQASTPTSLGYAYRFQDRTGVVLDNQSVSGRASFEATKNLLAVGSGKYRYGRRRDAIGWAAVLNEGYRGGAGTKTVSKLQGELRTFLSVCMSKYAVAMNDPSVTEVGTWGNVTTSALCPRAPWLRSGGYGRSSVTVGNTQSWTFSGETLLVGCYNTDGIVERCGKFSITVDGVLLETYDGDGKADGISDGSYDNRITHETRVFKSLGKGTHTVVLTVTDTAGGTRPVYLDCFGTLDRPQQCGPVLVSLSPRLAAAGYAYPGALWSPAALQTLDDAIVSVVNEYAGWPIAIVRINDFFDPLTGIGADDQHPNDLGYAQIAAAWLDRVATRAFPYQQGLLIKNNADQSTANGVYATLGWDNYFYDDEGWHDVATNNSRVTINSPCYLRFDARIGWAANATGVRAIYLFRNGSIENCLGELMCVSAGGEPTWISGWDEVLANPGDYFEIKAVQNSGGALNVLAASKLSAKIVH